WFADKTCKCRRLRRAHAENPRRCIQAICLRLLHRRLGKGFDGTPTPASRTSRGGSVFRRRPPVAVRLTVAGIRRVDKATESSPAEPAASVQPETPRRVARTRAEEIAQMHRLAGRTCPRAASTPPGSQSRNRNPAGPFAARIRLGRGARDFRQRRDNRGSREESE